MRKITVLITVLLCLAIVGCETTSPSTTQDEPVSGLPAIVRNARKNAPEGVLIGIGSYFIGNNPALMNQGRTIAENRARAEIARAMNTMVQQMITDYTATNELDHGAALGFQENINRSLTDAKLQGVVVNEEDLVDGTYFVVAYLSRAEVVNEIASAQESAKRLAPGAMASFNALDRMDELLGSATSSPLTVRDSD